MLFNLKLKFETLEIIRTRVRGSNSNSVLVFFWDLHHLTRLKKTWQRLNSTCLKHKNRAFNLELQIFRFNPRYRQNFTVGIFQDLSTLTDFNWIFSMVKSHLLDKYTIMDSSCGLKSNWALVQLCTCDAAANRFNVYVSGK
jgi:hypothetical protein